MAGHLLRRPDPLTPLFAPNTIIWRGKLEFAEYGVHRSYQYYPRWNFARRRNVDGKYVLGLHLHGCYTWEPEVVPFDEGIPVFVDGEPPDPFWTHLLVTSFNPGFSSCGAVHAKFAEPLDWHDYLDFRTSLFRSVRDARHPEWKDMIGRSVGVNPPYLENQRRLLTDVGDPDSPTIFYCHLRQPPPKVADTGK